MLFLQQFDLEVVYKPGKQHTNADSLSRVPSGVVSVAVPSDFYMYNDHSHCTSTRPGIDKGDRIIIIVGTEQATTRF